MWWIIHIVALIVFVPALFVTIPLHILDSTIRNRK